MANDYFKNYYLNVSRYYTALVFFATGIFTFQPTDTVAQPWLITQVNGVRLYVTGWVYGPNFGCGLEKNEQAAVLEIINDN
ncbi:MAG: hypothetical protein ACKO96_15750, partial [Flammeovirgaceae bacterium]